MGAAGIIGVAWAAFFRVEGEIGCAGIVSRRMCEVRRQHRDRGELSGEHQGPSVLFQSCWRDVAAVAAGVVFFGSAPRHREDAVDAAHFAQDSLRFGGKLRGHLHNSSQGAMSRTGEELNSIDTPSFEWSFPRRNFTPRQSSHVALIGRAGTYRSLIGWEEKHSNCQQSLQQTGAEQKTDPEAAASSDANILLTSQTYCQRCMNRLTKR